jgi:hypothetical protein
MRFEDWPKRLDAVIEAARHRPYKIGEHDCFTFARECVKAITGANYGKGIKYRTQAGSLKLIKRLGGSLDRAVSKVLRRSPVTPLQARRGDWLMFRDEKGEHLAVCLGINAACLGEHGLGFLPLDACLSAWPID